MSRVVIGVRGTHDNNKHCEDNKVAARTMPVTMLVRSSKGLMMMVEATSHITTLRP